MHRHIPTEMDLKASSLSSNYTVPPRLKLEFRIFFNCFLGHSTLTDSLGNTKEGWNLRHEDKVNQYKMASHAK